MSPLLTVEIRLEVSELLSVLESSELVVEPLVLPVDVVMLVVGIASEGIFEVVAE